ncbi:MAG: type III-A CRISPR-associated protein Csm2 [bacterium]
MITRKPMEEKLYEEWGLKTAEGIRNKIFENYSGDATLKTILDAEKLVVCSYALGRILSSPEVRLKVAQLRRFYEALLTIRAIIGTIRKKPKVDADESFKTMVRNKILMLKPRLADAKARQPREVTPFFEVINPLIDMVRDIEDYDRLCEFVEAIVAYHRYCGGRD